MFVRVMTELYLASGGVVNPPQDPPPAVSIVAPTDGATVSGDITVTANASDAGGVVSVAYRVDNGSETAMNPVGGNANNGQWQAPLDTTGLTDGLHRITVLASDTDGQTSSPFVNVNVRNSEAQMLHVERVDVVLLQKGGAARIQGRGDMFIYDAFGIPVAGATVSGHWTGAANDTFTVTTDSTGMATDYSNSTKAPSGSTFICVVDSVSKAGWEYDPTANNQGSGSATVP